MGADARLRNRADSVKPMSDPWAGVAPAAVTSVITTLSTLGITAGISKLRSAASTEDYPLLLRRTTGQNWVVRNESRRSLVRLNFNVFDADGNFLQPEQHHHYASSISVLEPDEEIGVGRIDPGHSITLYWWTLKRNRPERPKSAHVVVRADDVEYRPKAERGDRYGK